MCLLKWKIRIMPVSLSCLESCEIQDRMFYKLRFINDFFIKRWYLLPLKLLSVNSLKFVSEVQPCSGSQFISAKIKLSSVESMQSVSSASLHFSLPSNFIFFKSTSVRGMESPLKSSPNVVVGIWILNP